MLAVVIKKNKKIKRLLLDPFRLKGRCKMCDMQFGHAYNCSRAYKLVPVVLAEIKTNHNQIKAGS